MATSGLGYLGYIGSFYNALEIDWGRSWLPLVGMKFQSDHEQETYPWIGMSPAMREWIGGRQAKGFRDNKLTIVNKHYEATVEVLLRDFRRDKTGQIQVRINELAGRANAHWASLVSTLMLNAAATVCYDGQYFFDTDHSEGDSGTQSNSISVDISALPAIAHGSTTAPSTEEMQQAILAGISAIVGFKDDQGEPMNELGRNFLVMVPPTMLFVAQNALAMPSAANVTVQNALNGFNILPPVINPRLTWTASFVVFRTDAPTKSFIMQEETPVQMKVKGPESEYAFDNDAIQYGIDAWRNVGYGYWQHSCLVTLT